MKTKNVHPIRLTLILMFLFLSISILKAEEQAINQSMLLNKREKAKADSKSKLTITNDLIIGETDADFTKLSGISGAINYIRQNTLGANIKIKLKADYDPTGETYPISITSNVGNVNYSITICPEASLSMNVSNVEAIFKLDGARNLILDGRINAEGESIAWEMNNPNTSGAVIKFVNNANQDTLRYLSIKGSSYSYNGALVLFSSTNQAYGNNNNMLEYCEISNGITYPINLIYSGGTYNKANSNNTIRNCKLWGYTNTVDNYYCAGIAIMAYSANWTIYNNHIYQAEAIQAGNISPLSNTTLYGIQITEGGGHYVHHNYIGGNAPYCEGLTEILPGSRVSFYGIGVYASANNPSICEYNIIKNFKINSVKTADGFTGILLGGDALSNQTVRYNEVRNVDFIGSDNHLISGYKIGSMGNAKLNENMVDSLYCSSSVNSKTSYAYGVSIYQTTAGLYEIDKNIITNLCAGSLTSTSLNYTQGIYLRRCINTLICNNVIKRLNVRSTNYASYICGILIDYADNQVYNNMISLGGETGNPYQIYGIYDKNGNNSYYYNSLNVHGLYNSEVGNSYCFYSEINAVSQREIKNNQFYNQRNGAGSKNYAIRLVSTGNTDLDYNNYKAEIVGNFSGDKLDLQAWRLASLMDENSKSFVPDYCSEEDLHLYSVIGNHNYIAIPIAEITYDFDGDQRHLNYPFIGADEREDDLTLPVELSAFMGSVINSECVSLQWITQSESNMLGYHLFRGETQSFSQANRISSQLIKADNLSSENSYVYEDRSVQANSQYYYWLSSYAMNGSIESYGPIHIETDSAPGTVPEHSYMTVLLSFYPNPCNPTGNISFNLSERAYTEIKIYNLKGQLIRILNNSILSEGKHEILWDAKDSKGKYCSSGVYFCQMNTRNYSAIKKFMLLK